MTHLSLSDSFWDVQDDFVCVNPHLVLSISTGVQPQRGRPEEQGLGLHQLHLQALRGPDGSGRHPVLHEVQQEMNRSDQLRQGNPGESSHVSEELSQLTSGASRYTGLRLLYK